MNVMEIVLYNKLIPHLILRIFSVNFNCLSNLLAFSAEISGMISLVLSDDL